MRSDWYSLADLPPGRVIIRVWWMAHGVPKMMDVTRAWLPNSRTWTWMTYVKDDEDGPGEVITLPPRDWDKERWSPEPICWQPRNDAWTWPGKPPTPLSPHRVPTFVGTTQSFDAAELAAEMERDREDAAHRHDADEPGPRRPKPRWWIDVNAIKYEPLGEMTPKMVEGRLLRSLAWCGAGNTMAPKGSSSSFLASMATTIAADVFMAMDAESRKDVAKAAADHQSKRLAFAPFNPVRQDYADFAISMAWFTALNPPDNWQEQRKAWALNRQQRIMLARASRIPLSWAEIGASFANIARKDPGISGTRCQQIYAKGMEACWRVANGGEAFPGRRITDQIEALRERNRAHKRSETRP